jgi:hypothetical protein
MGKLDLSSRRTKISALCARAAIAAILCIASHSGLHAQASSQHAQQSQAASATPASTATAPSQAAGNQAILDHLNAVLRFYRDSQAPIQKVGEPSDLLYRDQAVNLATQIAGFAFQSAKAEGALNPNGAQGTQSAPPQSQAQRMQALRQQAEQKITDLKAQDAALAQQIAAAKPKAVAALQQQRDQVQGQLELQTAMGDALTKIVSMGDTSSEGGFAAQIDQMERSAPGISTGKPAAVAPTLDNLSAARSEGVTNQAKVLFELLGSRQAIDNLVKEDDDVHAQAIALRAPLTVTLRNTIAQGQALSQQAAPVTPATPTASAAVAPRTAATPATPGLAAQAAATRKSFDALTRTFKNLSGTVIPLSEEIVALEQARAGLEAWRNAVNQEYLSILRSLLLRVAGIAIALAVIFILGEVWKRATNRYVHEVRRRRQLLVIRRLLVGFLSGLVLIFGLVTQFSSLATFAGFITAGIAVGLQTILLSVAAYFFIIGRYGVKVGDRITITGVTGDVIEVGLVRFFMQEMAGSGTDLYPTGRVAVFSNAVLFQAGTPLYKQMPGTDYAWHELTIKLSADIDYRPAAAEILKTTQSVYDGYRGTIEQQHKSLEAWIDTAIDTPAIQSNLQLVDGGGLQLWIRFPVMIRQASAIDDKMTESLLSLIASNPNVKSAVAAPPVIKAAVKG